MLFMARTLGFGGQALDLIIKKIANKDRKPEVISGYKPDAHDVFVTCFSKSGRSSEFLSATQRDEIDACMLITLSELGSDFPYKDLFMST